MLALTTAVAHAQKVGDTEEAVIKALGNPPLTRDSGDHQTWMYPNGTKVVLQGGVVVEFKMGAATPAAATDEDVLKQEARQLAPSKANVRHAPATAQDRPEPAATNSKNPFAKPYSAFGLLLAVVAWGLMVVCAIVILVEAFRASILWGLAVLFIPFGQLIFVFTHWADTKKPFLLTWLVGVPLIIASFFV